MLLSAIFSIKVPDIPSSNSLFLLTSSKKKKLNLVALYSNDLYFLGEFADFWKECISFVCLSVRPYFCLQWNSSAPTGQTDFRDIWYLRIFRKSDEKVQVCDETLTKRFAEFSCIHDGVYEECCRIDFRENLFSDIHILLNLLKTKRNLLYIRNQSVPRSKHFPPRL